MRDENRIDEMCEELKQELIRINKIDEFRIVQIKEKFGELRFYTNWTTNEIEAIINKYTKEKTKMKKYP